MTRGRPNVVSRMACALFVGLGGMLGYIPLLAKVLPIACLAPILIFVAFDIVAQSFHETPPEHAPAITRHPRGPNV